MAQTPYPRSDRELIRRIERSPGHRAGYKQLVREFGLGGGRERRLLLEQLARITARGELVKIDTEQWSLPAAAPEKTARASRNAEQPVEHLEHRANRDRLVAGKIDLHRDGYAFVRPNQSTSREDDLFIPPNEINGAMQGDEVLVDEAPPGRDGRRSGRVARVLTRRNPTVVGIFHYARSRGRSNSWESAPLINGNYVTPLDERMTQGILIPEGAEIAVTPTVTPHRVLGEEAQAQQAHWTEELDPHWPLEGLAVDIEITDFPAPGRPARGRVLEVLGPPDAFGVDVEIVIRKHHLPYTFPANVLAEATASAAQTVETLAADELKRRRDFRGLPIVTIDGETARDFDDAVLVEPLANGNWQLQVHIADVSHYVRPGTALDLEARLRGTSVYFPDRAIPMLPNQLSSGMCSLRPDEDRLVLSCLMEIDGRGEVLGYELCEGIIRSARRMTYTQIQAVLDGDAATRKEFAALVPDFERMYELALKLNAKRHRRGSIDFDLPEPVVQFDPEGNMEAIVRSQRGWSHRLIEEFMLSANECVAHWIEAQGVPSVYRIHEMPDPKRIVDFEETASQFGYSLGFSSLPVKRVQTKADRRSVRGTNRTAKTHEVAESIPVTPQMYQRLTAKIAGKPEERILAYLMLRSLKQARYSEQNVGHFALASPSYTHFTSPIRRYPDLIVHRLLRDLLQRGANPQGAAILSTDPQPWREMSDAKQEAKHTSSQIRLGDAMAPIPEAEIAVIATESSQAERRADDAERELIEWKKIRFMEDRVGEDFNAIILSCTKYGFFVELDDLFIEGLVPIASLQDDRYFFRDTDRQIVGARNGHIFKMGLRVHVLLDRIDRQQKRLQFALLPDERESEGTRRSGSLRRAGKNKKVTSVDDGRTRQPSPDRSGKPRKTKGAAAKKKVRKRDKVNKGKKKRG
ncbi:ribonuclease R family protein [Edaphobacter dinghuensis]|uniref:Ribonuclease R n=1 Tax=Edaphobacter dinghuensis TaxID=1560005 RepID=A0A917LY18_9BACT|nr:VacB/RNase II family 3'-5' exoribonuclease [Edaphobacter dinghuensis]GGG63306.1 ribonuclease R [Edaphobacter dinghuensis]